MVSTSLTIFGVAIGSANCVKFISNVLDPAGSQVQRSFILRFFTITLPENILLPSLNMVTEL